MLMVAVGQGGRSRFEGSHLLKQAGGRDCVYSFTDSSLGAFRI